MPSNFKFSIFNSFCPFMFTFYIVQTIFLHFISYRVKWVV